MFKHKKQQSFSSCVAITEGGFPSLRINEGALFVFDFYSVMEVGQYL